MKFAINYPMRVRVTDRLVAQPTGSVLYYPGYPMQGSTIYDYSGNALNGTISGATWTRLPSGLWVLSFDGNDYVTTTNCQNAAAGALEAWVRPSVLTTTEYIIFCDDGSGYLKLEIYTTPNPFRFVSYDTGAHTAISTLIPVINVWYHVVGTYANGSKTTLYINGVKDGEGTAMTGNLGGTASAMVIGKSGPLYWRGDIALERIYNTVPATTTWANHYNQERHLVGA